MKSIIFLYSEMMPYMESVIKSLVNDFGLKIYVVSWDEKKNTNYIPNLTHEVTHYNRSEMSFIKISEIIELANPVIIYVSGRMDKLYLKVAKKYRNSIPTVAGIDTQWQRNLKSYVKSTLSSILYKPFFSHIWVPGERQYMLAEALGYSSNSIINNLYSCDYELFNNVKPLNFIEFKKNIVFIGRLEKSKGFDILMKCWQEFNESDRSGWRLKVIGSGSLLSKFQSTEGVDFLGFLNQSKICEELNTSSVFILPSVYEPWGVVVHELACAGRLLICSENVGAVNTFLINGFNGFKIAGGSSQSTSEILKQVFSMNTDEVISMGCNSRTLAKRITPKLSAASLISII
jgi:glycosyltransferase involved in cell wall biosynthesis